MLAIAFAAFLFAGSSLAHAQGIINTVAGPELTGSNGFTLARLSLPNSVAVDSSGSSPAIYTADPPNCVVWKTQAGVSSVFAGVQATSTYQCPGGAATSSPTTTPLVFPNSVAMCNGNLFVVTQGFDPLVLGTGTETAGAAYEIDASGTLTALPALPAGPANVGPQHPVAATCGANGNLYVSAYGYQTGDGANPVGQLDEYQPVSGGGWSVSAPTSLNAVPGFTSVVTSLAVSPTNGDLYGLALVGDASTGWLGPPTPGGAGDGGFYDLTQNTPAIPGGNNSFPNPSALVIDGSGNFYVAAAGSTASEPSSYIYEVTPGGARTVIAGTGLNGYSGDGGLSTSAEIYGVDGLALDNSGALYLADSKNERVRAIHLLAPGPQQLALATQSVPQSGAINFGLQQAVLTSPGGGDFYYTSGSNLLNVLNSGSSIASPGFERIVASIPVGKAGRAGASSLIAVADPTRNLIYAYNSADGNLYAIDGSYGTTTSHTVAGQVALNNANVTLLAIDTGLNEIYAAGPNASSISAIRGGLQPSLIGNYNAAFIASLTVDPGTHVVYGVSNTGAGNGHEEALFAMTPAGSSESTPGALTVNESVFSAPEAILAPDFIANSISVYSPGNLVAAGAASIDSLFNQTSYSVYDDFFAAPSYSSTDEFAQSIFTWPPLTAVVDQPDGVFYVTDFPGSPNQGASSNAAMVTGLSKQSLTSTAIPVFGSGQTPSSPQVYDIEPDTSSFQAWISQSSTAGCSVSGFGAGYGTVELWDARSQAITESVCIPNNGGGHLIVNSQAHAGYLLDEVNQQLWLINTPPWTTVASPAFSQSQGGQSVTITAGSPNDTAYYTLDGTPPIPGQGSTASCGPTCSVNVTAGVLTSINAIEVNMAGNAGNDVEGIFTAQAPTTATVAIATAPVGTGISDTATVTITPTSGVSSVTGTVTFTATLSASSQPVTLCQSVSVQLASGSWQASCGFSLSTAGSYQIQASYSGDTLNQASTGSASLSVFELSLPSLGTVTGGGANAVAINANNPPNLSYNAVLNNDSSVSLLAQGAILTGQGCPAFTLSGAGLSVSSGAVFVDATDQIIYLAMLATANPSSGAVSGFFAGYESIDNQGNCTLGPLVQVDNQSFGTIEMNVDVTQGNVYLSHAFSGGTNDLFYILPTAPTWSSSAQPTITQLNLDYSAEYGPIVIDSSNDRVYINDLGGSAFGNAGTYATSGFFVYDPKQSATPSSNLAHVLGYIPSSSTTQTPFNVGTLLTNGAGKVVLVNENPNATSFGSPTNLTTPLTVLDTTQFSFFTNTTPATSGGGVYIAPGSALSTIAATAQYSAASSADINPSAGLVYLFGYNANSSTSPGELLQYSIAPGASTPESVLNPSVNMPQLYDSNSPWSQLNYNPESTELVLYAGFFGSGALAATSPLCSGTPYLATLVGNAGTSTPFDAPVVNDASGYVYAIQPGSSFVQPPTSEVITVIAPPASGCTATPLQISTTSLPVGIVGGSYSATLSANGGSGTGYTWQVISGTGLSAVGLSLSSAGMISGTPTAAETAASVTVQVTDSLSNVATQTYSLTIYPALGIAPATLPNGTAGTAYSQTLTATGGSGTGYTWQVASGTGLSAVGLSLSSSGAVSGTPSTTETAGSFTVQVTDSLGFTATQPYQLTVSSSTGPAPIQVTVTENVGVSDANSPALNAAAVTENIGISEAISMTIGAIAPPQIAWPAPAPITYGTPLGSAQLDATDTVAGTFTYTPPSGTVLGAGANQALNVTFTPANTNLYLPATATTAITVTQAATATAFTINPSPAAAGQTVTFTATVTPATSGSPSGSVTFECPNYQPGESVSSGPIAVNNGTAVWQTTSLAAFDYNQCLTASYSGDTNFQGSTSTQASLTVSDYQINMATLPSTLVLLPGQSTSFSFTVGSLNGSFNQPIVFTVTGLPSGVTAKINPETVTPGSSPVTVTITITAGMQARQAMPKNPWGETSSLAFALVAPLLGLSFGWRRRLGRTGWLAILFVFSLVALAGIEGCGGNPSSNQNSESGTITVTGTSGTAQHSVTFKLTVV